ncbi:hypothetical protein AVEN_50328-1 [Araneus ventricosus]|uniref:Uncharacterized protein n=1 Tax=Araneus ventricosus TaxID=182803 RepID=A0A4Y2R2R7_ARAVE|nr:hypothetical protein AVEN_10340-1 [Araneus ventricosus]GBN77656.1 hypothetical protein AVEN_50328-1 [Araneus ventricosus]
MSKKVKDILFLHAFSRCDSTSAIFRQGKTKFTELLDKDAGIRKAAEVFKTHHAAVGAAGEKIIDALYGSSLQSSSINKIRFTIFTKSLVQNKFILSTLALTEAGARLHFEELLDVDADHNFEEEQFLWLTSQKGAKVQKGVVLFP